MKAKRLMSIVLVIAMVATLATFPTFAASAISLSAANVTTAPTGGTGDLANLFDGNNATGHLVPYPDYSWSGSADPITSNNVYVFDLGANYDNPELTLVWGGQSTHGWGWSTPGDYTVSYSADNSAYTTAVAYADIFDAVTNDTLPEGLTASRNTDTAEYILTAVTSIAANGVRYIKIETTSFGYSGIALNEVSVTGTLSATQSGEPTSYTVEYIDQNGDPVVEPKVVNEGVYSNSPVTEFAPVVYGYDNVNTTETLTLSANAEENVITFNYIKKVETSYTVEYVDQAGNPIADAKVVDYNVFVGDEFTELAITISGYTVVGDVSLTKEIVDGDNVFTFTYKVYTSISGPHSTITGLTGANVTTSVTIDTNTSNLDKLFDGDSTSYGTADGVPLEGNGLFDTTNWYSEGDKAYVIVDLGDIYELSQVGTYWGWAPEGNPNWNNWQFPTPTGYSIYVADTLEGLDTAAPAFVREGLVRDEKTLVGNDVATLSCWGRYVKIDATLSGANFALREITFMGAEYIDPDNNTTVTFEYRDEFGNELAPSVDVTKTTDKVVDIEAIEIIGYAPLNDVTTVTFDTDKVVVIEYKAIPSVVVAPAEDGTSSVGAEKVPFVFTIATPENVSPEAEFAAANWATDNCEVVDVQVISDGMYGTVYGWKVIVTVAPTDVDRAYSLELDLPDAYEQTDVVSIARTPSKSTLDSAIAVGENTVTVSANTVVIELNEMGMVTTDRSKRKVFVTLTTQTVDETLLPYKGYNDVVVELKNVESAGVGFSYKATDFVKVGNEYYGELLAHKYGADQLKFTLAIYGIAADGTKVELDTVVVRSEVLQVVEPEKKPDPTPAENLYNKIIPTDILSQLIGQVNPYALPEISDADWALFTEVSELREKGNLEQLRADYDAYRASEPAGDYTDDLVIDVNKQIQASVYLWNFLKDVKVDTITFTNLPFAQVNGVEGSGDIEDVSVTFRYGIDYDKLNMLKGGDFNLRVRINLTEADPSASTIGKAYNAVRRALDDDQLMPIFFRLDWYTWADLPFTGGVFTVKVSDNWIDNNGRFNMVAYHLTSYDYDTDNTPSIDKVEDDLTIMPITNEIKFAVDGGSNGSKIYDTYVIVSTNKLPSELPESIG